jgi:hypothetical protein
MNPPPAAAPFARPNLLDPAHGVVAVLTPVAGTPR